MGLFAPLIPYLAVLLGGMAHSGQVFASRGHILYPQSRTVIVHAALLPIIGEYDTTNISSIIFLRPFRIEKDIPITREDQKLGFAKALFDLVPERFVFGGIQFRTDRDAVAYRYPPVDLIDLDRFWESADLKLIWRMVHDKKTSTSRVALTGWTRTDFVSTEDVRESMAHMFSVSVPLWPGLNEFRILFLDRAGTTVVEDSLGVFCAIPMMSDAPPDGYEETAFHGQEGSDMCAACHSADPDAEEPELDCASCHQAFADLPSYHAAAEDCALCHDLSSEEEHRLLDGLSLDTEFCYMCHADKQESIESSDVQHAAVFECVTCHDLHGTTYPALLRDRTKTLCLGCHPDQEQRRHPSSNHPYEAKNEKNRPGKALSCSSCHDPHSSAQPKLIRFGNRPICINCHT